MCGSSLSLNAVTSAGPGDTVDLGVPFANHTVVVDTTGSPSDITVVLEVSHDGSTWAQANKGSVFYSGSPAAPVSFTGAVVAQYVRATLAEVDGGTSPTVSATISSL